MVVYNKYFADGSYMQNQNDKYKFKISSAVIIVALILLVALFSKVIIQLVSTEVKVEDTRIRVNRDLDSARSHATSSKSATEIMGDKYAERTEKVIKSDMTSRNDKRLLLSEHFLGAYLMNTKTRVDH